MESVLLTKRWARMGHGYQECTGLGNLCMCVCTFMCACVCMHVCACVSMYTHVCMSTVHVCMPINVCMYMYICMSIVHVCICIPMCACVCACLLCMCVYTCPCVYVYVWRRPGQRKRVGKQAKFSVVLSVKAG
jgi:hypothetical protein